MIKLNNVCKRLGNRSVLENISFRIERGKIMVLAGPSGCGKTTLLRLIAGFERPDRGEIMLNGINADEFPPHARNIGMVFQDLALWPHMRVKENVGFCLKNGTYNRKQKEEKIRELLRLTGMTRHIDCYPAQLSGGEQQRVALARALAAEPDILLLDEPLSDLDSTLREELQKVVLNIQIRSGITALYVTHNREEAFVMADTITVINDGRIEQSASAEEIRRAPATEFVKRFLRL